MHSQNKENQNNVEVIDNNTACNQNNNCKIKDRELYIYYKTHMKLIENNARIMRTSKSLSIKDYIGK